MEKKEILDHLNRIKENRALSEHDKTSLKEAIRLIKAKDWKDNLFKIAELLIKLFGVGSNL